MGVGVGAGEEAGSRSWGWSRDWCRGGRRFGRWGRFRGRGGGVQASVHERAGTGPRGAGAASHQIIRLTRSRLRRRSLTRIDAKPRLKPSARASAPSPASQGAIWPPEALCPAAVGLGGPGGRLPDLRGRGLRMDRPRRPEGKIATPRTSRAGVANLDVFQFLLS